MAIWMEAGSEPRRVGEAVDLKAISALKQSALLELKEKGNEYAKMGEMDYLDAIDFYARAINQKALDDAEQSTLYSNRAQLISSWVTPRCWRGNRTLPSKCQRFLSSSQSIIISEYEANFYWNKALDQSPDDEELKKLAKQIDLQKSV